MKGVLRKDGRKGIRNVVAVAYLVECAHHVSRLIVQRSGADDVHLIGFPGCYPNKYSLEMMQRLCTHPNVGAVLLVSLGCEGFNREQLRKHDRRQRPARRPAGHPAIRRHHAHARMPASTSCAACAPNSRRRRRCRWRSTSSSSAPCAAVRMAPAASRRIPRSAAAFDWLIDNGAACIFEETGELIGCERIMASRAVTPALGREIEACVDKAANYYRIMGYGSFAPGNAEGGLTTLEEKSMGAYSKSGSSPISGLIKPGDIPPRGGLYLLDVVPDGEPRFGFPNISDNAEIVELIACGSHVILFTTGRGSVVGSAISPVIKVCANPDTYERMADDMDVNAGRILQGAELDEVGREIFDLVLRVAAGELSKSEALGHQEFILTYKQFEPIGPACLPAA